MLVANRDAPWELFHLTRDRSEVHNLADTQPDRVKAPAAKWQSWAERVGAKPWPEVHASMTKLRNAATQHSQP